MFPGLMLAALVHVKLAAHLMSGWLAASAPVPLPAASIAIAIDQRAATPVEIPIYDVNRHVTNTIVVNRDGTYTPAMAKKIAHVFRCRTEHEHVIAHRTLAMLAAMSDRYAPHPIALISGYRVRRGESWTSPHRHARAIDFRIEGIDLSEVRDWLWNTYRDVGIGWYPAKQFIHMDSRRVDMSWTYIRGLNHYDPGWSWTRQHQRARSRVGV